MALNGNRQDGSRRRWWRRPPRLATQVMAGAGLAGALSLALAGCGGSSASSKIDLSVSSGPVSTVVDVSGHAGSGCVMDRTWLGFDFSHYGQVGKGPMTAMTAPVVVSNGTWSATFAIPSYLGGSSPTGTGGPVTPGKYEFSASSCTGHTLSTATFDVTSATPATNGSDFAAIAATVDGQGYWLVQQDGAVSAFGDAHSYGSLPADEASTSKIVGIARTYDGHGYWLVAADGHVFPFGDAHNYGSAPDNSATEGAVTSMAVTPDGRGYWILTSDGHVFSLGDAHPEGSPSAADAPFAAIGTRPAGGYVVTAANNAAAYLFPGDIAELGGGTGTALSATLVGVAVTPSGNGTWQTGLDGGVVTTGQTTQTYATFYGSVPGENEQLKAPVTGIAGSPDGLGYWLVGANGTVYVFGSAKFFGNGKS